jgi:hypothetical protein
MAQHHRSLVQQTVVAVVAVLSQVAQAVRVVVAVMVRLAAQGLAAKATLAVRQAA